MPIAVTRAACVLLCCSCVCSQASPAPTLRDRLDLLFRGPAPRPREIEWNGNMVRVADLTQRSQELSADPDLHDQEQLILAALTADLQQRKAWPSDAEFEDAFASYRKPYDSTPFTTEVIAMRFKGYPGLDAFAQRWRVRWAFERTLGAIDPKALQQEADARRDFFGGGQIAVELWFYPARDDTKGRWDFAAAERRSRQGLADLGIGKDPAEVRVQTDAVAGGRVKDQLLHYSVLRQTMGESEYTDLVRGYSAADTVFYDARPGELQGPLRGVRGWWLARVCQRTHAETAFEVNDERREQFVREVYLQRRFLEWAAAALAKAVLRAPAKVAGSLAGRDSLLRAAFDAS